MIPILYNSDETSFVSNGVGRLSDCTRCIVTEERNGIYECEFDYPITGVHFDEIAFGRIIGCTHDDVHDIQPFIIYSRNVPDLNGIVTFHAYHISYKLNEIVTMPFTASSIADAFNKIKSNSVNDNPFTFWTDKTTQGAFACDVPKAIRGMLGGEEGSILDVYGAGDYKFDRFDVKLYAHRGVDSDVEIRYSKNLTELSETIDAGSTYNAVIPFWASNEGQLVTLPEKIIVYSGIQPLLAYLTDENLIVIRTEDEEPIEVAYHEINAVPMDMSDAFESAPTAAQLRSAAQTRFENSDAWLPKENLTVDFVQLWQTAEFKDYAAMQRVSLCDTVSVYYPAVGIRKVKQRVIKVVYNVLLDRYDAIELGTPQNSLGQIIKSDVLRDVPTTSMMESAIQYATELIRGGLGGYVVMTPGPNGYPQEILIMDTPDVNTAVNVWRFNQGGLGHSHSGYEGPFDDIALTKDGKINATMITTGVLNANLITAGVMSADRIRGGTLEIGGLNNENGKIDIYDNRERLVAKVDNGAFLAYNPVKINGYYEGTQVGAGQLVFYKDATSPFLMSETIGSIYSSYLPSSYDRMNFRAHGGVINLESDSSGGAAHAYLTLYPETQTYTSPGTSNTYSVDAYESGNILFHGTVYCANSFAVIAGTKSKIVETENYQARGLYCYETPTPLFGDIGEAVIDEDGYAYVDIDDIFTETIANKVEYQVFLQKEGEGDCWIADKTPRYFIVKGTPKLKVAWELKAKQKDFELYRFEPMDTGLDEYVKKPVDDNSMEDYITKQEELLYG